MILGRPRQDLCYQAFACDVALHHTKPCTVRNDVLLFQEVLVNPQVNLVRGELLPKPHKKMLCSLLLHAVYVKFCSASQ